MKKNNYALVALAFGIITMSFTTTKTAVDETTNEGVELLLKIDLSENTDAQGWGSWSTTDCMKGLDFRVRKDGYNKYAKKYRWSLEFRNRYRDKINFSYIMVEPNGKRSIRESNKTTHRTRADAGEKVSGSFFLVNSDNYVYVYVNKIRFGQKDYGSSYAKCDK